MKKECGILTKKGVGGKSAPVCAVCFRPIGNEVYIHIEDACFCRACVERMKTEEVLELFEYGSLSKGAGCARKKGNS